MQPFQVPLTVGVTGHRQIAEDCTATLEAAVDTIFARLREKAPDAPLLLLTGLAEGADRLVARIARERHGAELLVVLPRAAQDYRKDFTSADSAAEIVRAKLKGRYPGRDDDEPLHYDEGGAVAHVITARAGETPPENVGQTQWLYPDAVRIGARSGEHRAATVVSAFNTLNRLLKTDGQPRDARSNVDALKTATDRLASQFQRRANTAVRIMVLATVVAAISTAIHSTVDSIVLPIITGGAVALGFAVWAFSTWRKWQRLHTDLRALAEAGRIQAAWIASGLGLCVADHYHPAQATSVAWIRRAIRAAFLLDNIQPPKEPSPQDRKRHAAAGHAWIDEQVAYFLGNHGVVRRYRQQARQFAILGFVCLGIGLAIAAGNKLLDVTHLQQTVLDTKLLLLIGRIALAITTSVSAYQAFMAFGDLQRSFAVSAHLFSLARDEAKAAAETDDHPRLIRLIVKLGRAALVENVSWVILRRQRRVKPSAG